VSKIIWIVLVLLMANLAMAAQQECSNSRFAYLEKIKIGWNIIGQSFYRPCEEVGQAIDCKEENGMEYYKVRVKCANGSIIIDIGEYSLKPVKP
jgi:hypothetical protein